MGFEKIIGYESEKKELMQLQKMLQNMNSYREKGVRLPKGILLCGQPGVGKTLMARSMAGKEISLIELRAADCCGEELNSSIQNAFEEAKRNKPAVLLLDELDKVAGTSNEFFMESNDEVKRILLQELDDLRDEDEVLVVATCNSAESLGEALTRPGRFDHMLEISLPDQDTRQEILSYYFRKIYLRKRFSLEDLVRLTGGMSCADLECLVNETGIQALNQGKKSISTKDVVTVINRINFGGAEKQTLLEGEKLHRVAVHEAGHALTAMMLMPDTVYGASVLPQGGSLGHVRMMEAKDEEACVEDIQNQICICLAGRTAEREVLGKTYLGSEEDLHNAAKQLMALITTHAVYGYRYLLCNFPMIPGAASEEVAGSLGRMFEQKMEQFDRQTALLINNNRELFYSIVFALENEKTLTRDHLFELKELAVEKAEGEDTSAA